MGAPVNRCPMLSWSIDPDLDTGVVCLVDDSANGPYQNTIDGAGTSSCGISSGAGGGYVYSEVAQVPISTVIITSATYTSDPDFKLFLGFSVDAEP